MRTRRRVLYAAGLVIALAATTWILAETPPDPRPGATGPVREQNLDGSGYIAVHEQGVAAVDITNSELDVNVTNGTLQVTGTADVGNFPDTQDVHVVGGELGVTLAPVTTMQHHMFTAAAGSTELYSFTTIDATMISVAGFVSSEYVLYLHSPLWPEKFRWFPDNDGEELIVQTSFTHPIPINGVSVYGTNESESCAVVLNVFGY